MKHPTLQVPSSPSGNGNCAAEVRNCDLTVLNCTLIFQNCFNLIISDVYPVLAEFRIQGSVPQTIGDV